MGDETPIARTCAQCGTQVAPTLLACPACGRLVYAEQLRALAAAAEDAAARGDVLSALSKWREALDLLPPGSRQHEVVSQKVSTLSDAVGAGEAGPPPAKPVPTTPAAGRGTPPPPHAGHAHRGLKGAAVAAGGIALLLWKFKAVLVFVLTKGKLLLLGLTKTSTLLSMVLSLGVYWTVWGWPFALGLVLSIYVHEMGHVIALRRYGFKATAPMFIPGLGALIRLKQRPVNPREDAAIGLAGPLYGLAAAVVCLVAWQLTDRPILGAIARIGAWINLFNLLPLGPLDGGRAFGPLSRRQRWLAVAAIGAAWTLTSESLLVLLLIVAAIRAAGGGGDERGDARATALYIGLLAALSAMCLLRVPVPG